MSKKIIACLDIFEGRVVKGVNFVDFRDAGDPVECARAYCAASADELVFLDISATDEGRDTCVDLARRVAEAASIPFCVGGGIRSVADIQKILDAGADKVSINSAAFNCPKLISDAVGLFGGRRIVLALDAKKNANGGFNVLVGGGKIDTGSDAVEWAIKAEALGVGEILLTSLDADGTKNGFDIELTKAVTNAVSIPVTASGGAGSREDFLKVFNECGVDAALAASLFHFGEINIMELKKYLADNGVCVIKNG